MLTGTSCKRLLAASLLVLLAGCVEAQPINSAKFATAAAFAVPPEYTLVAQGANVNNTGASLRWSCAFNEDQVIVEYKDNNLTLPECTEKCDLQPRCRSLHYWKDARYWRCLLLTCSGSLTATKMESYSLLRNVTATFKLLAEGNTATNTVADKRRFLNAFNTTNRLFIRGHSTMDLPSCLKLCKGDKKCAGAFLYRASSVWTCIGLKSVSTRTTSTALDCYSFVNTEFDDGSVTLPAGYTLSSVGNTANNTDTPMRFAQAFDSTFILFDVPGLSAAECTAVCESNSTCMGVFFYKLNLIWRCQGLSNISGPLVKTSQLGYSMAKKVPVQTVAILGVYLTLPYTQATLAEVSSRPAGYGPLSNGHMLTQSSYDYYNRVPGWVRNASHGLMDFSPFKVTQLDLSSYISNSVTCNVNSWIDAAKLEMNRIGDNVTLYDKIAIVMPPTASQSTSCIQVGAYATTCCLTIYSAWSAYLGTIVHELGHNLGLPHANSIDCINRGTAVSMMYGPGCVETEYGDPLDPMGRNVGINHFNPVFSDKLGWIAAEDLLTLTPVSSKSSPSVTTVILAPFAAQGKSAIPGAMRAVKLELPAPSTGPLAGVRPGTAYIAFRSSVGNDAGYAYKNRVYLHWKVTNEGGQVIGLRVPVSYIIDTKPTTDGLNNAGLDVGESWTDPTGGVTITFLQRAANLMSATVKIEFGISHQYSVRNFNATLIDSKIRVEWAAPEDLSVVQGYTATVFSDSSPYFPGDEQGCSLRETGVPSMVYRCEFPYTMTNARYTVSVTPKLVGSIIPPSTGAFVNVPEVAPTISSVSYSLSLGKVELTISYPLDIQATNLPDQLQGSCGNVSFEAKPSEIETFMEAGAVKQRYLVGYVVLPTFTCTVAAKRGNSPLSPAVSTSTITSPGPVARAIRDLDVTHYSSGFTFDWLRDSSTYAPTGYQISIDGGGWSDTTPVVTGTSLYKASTNVIEWDFDSVFEVGSTHLFAIRAVNQFGPGPVYTVGNVTYCGPAKAPTNVVANGANGHIYVTWDPPVEEPGCEADGYRMQLQPASVSSAYNFRSTPYPMDAYYTATTQTNAGSWGAGSAIVNDVNYRVIVHAKNVYSSSQGLRAAAVFATPSTSGPSLPVITVNLLKRVARGVTSPINYTVTAESPDGGFLTYEWMINNKKISGETKSFLYISSIDLSHAGTFACLVSNNRNGQKTMLESYARLTVTTPPIVDTHPVSILKRLGNKASFFVTASTTETPYDSLLTYQWIKDGVAIANAIARTYFVYPLEASDAGSYVCNVTLRRFYDAESAYSESEGAMYTYGTVSSNPATLTIDDVAAVTIVTQPTSSLSLTVGQSVSLSVVATGSAGGSLSYQWRKNGVSIFGATLPTYSIGAATLSTSGSYSVIVTDTRNSLTRALESNASIVTVA